MLYWECKRRLAVLREFRMQAVDYFENIEYAGWMAGGAPPRMNEKAQKARNYMNRVLGDVLVSLSRLNVPHVVNFQPPPRLGGYPQNVDVILNIFSLWEFPINTDLVFDTIDRAIGAYERECEKLFRKLFNPLYWLGMLVLQFLRLPSKLRGTGGNDVPGTDQSLFGSIRQGWAGWNRGDRLGLAAIVVAVVVGVSAVVNPELRLILHLDKPVAAPVEPSPAQVAPAQTTPPVTPPAKGAPEQTKPAKPKTTTTQSIPQKIEINAAGGIPIVGNQGTVTNPTVNNYGPPERRLTDSQADALANAAALIPASQKISVESCNMPECERFADAIYAALKRKSPPSLASGPIIALVGWSGGTPPRGTVVCLHSVDSPTKPYAQPIANTLNEDKSVPTNFTSCKRLAENEIKIIIAAP